MQPMLQHHEAFEVAGLTVRTSNQEESDPRTTRIAALWTRFFDERVYATAAQRADDKRLYSVYSGYESDARGAFDVTAGVAVSESPSALQIEAGNYLVFTGQGQMPQMVMAVWQAIWQYFEQHPEIKRRYRSDFEAYGGPDQVAIHIGVE